MVLDQRGHAAVSTGRPPRSVGQCDASGTRRGRLRQTRLACGRRRQRAAAASSPPAHAGAHSQGWKTAIPGRTPTMGTGMPWGGCMPPGVASMVAGNPGPGPHRRCRAQGARSGSPPRSPPAPGACAASAVITPCWSLAEQRLVLRLGPARTGRSAPDRAPAAALPSRLRPASSHSPTRQAQGLRGAGCRGWSSRPSRCWVRWRATSKDAPHAR